MHADISTVFSNHADLAQPLDTALGKISYTPLSSALYALRDKAVQFEAICSWDLVQTQIGKAAQKELSLLVTAFREGTEVLRMLLDDRSAGSKFQPIYQCHKNLRGDDWQFGDSQFVASLETSASALASWLEKLKPQLTTITDAGQSILSLLKNAEHVEPRPDLPKQPIRLNLSSMFSAVTFEQTAFAAELSNQIEATSNILEIARTLKQAQAEAEKAPSSSALGSSIGAFDLDLLTLPDFLTGSR